MRDLTYTLLLCTIVSGPATVNANAQASPLVAPTPSSGSSTEVEQKLEAITRQQLDQSQQEIIQLQAQLAAVRRQLASNTAPLTRATTAETDPPQSGSSSSQSTEERLQTLEAQVKVHDQMKVESASKYPVRVTGLILFNSFMNLGSVDNIDLPSIAIRQPAGTSNGSAGASLRQTILDPESRAREPRLT